ncbi:MAG: hypothetical protein GY696_27860 [Gammaproteobacteria bacterium]|nr:hypothetical protein [Gammaproteobacteria bacterium]
MPNLEILAVELTSRRKRIIVASVYKPPSSDNDAFVSDFTDTVSELRADLVLMGDTNIDALSKESHLLNQSLAACIHEPTHLQRCLDHIFMSEDAQDCLTSGIGPPVEKHHSIVWVKLRNCCIGRAPKRTSTVWKWEDGDWGRGSFLLTHWVHNNSERDLAAEILNPDLPVDVAADHLNAELFDIQSLVVPHKEVWFRRKTCPWMNKRLLRIIQRRNVAYRQHKEINSATDLAATGRSTAGKPNLLANLLRENISRKHFKLSMGHVTSGGQPRNILTLQRLASLI